MYRQAHIALGALGEEALVVLGLLGATRRIRADRVRTDGIRDWIRDLRRGRYRHGDHRHCDEQECCGDAEAQKRHDDRSALPAEDELAEEAHADAGWALHARGVLAIAVR